MYATLPTLIRTPKCIKQKNYRLEWRKVPVKWIILNREKRANRFHSQSSKYSNYSKVLEELVNEHICLKGDQIQRRCIIIEHITKRANDSRKEHSLEWEPRWKQFDFTSNHQDISYQNKRVRKCTCFRREQRIQKKEKKGKKGKAQGNMLISILSSINVTLPPNQT